MTYQFYDTAPDFQPNLQGKTSAKQGHDINEYAGTRGMYRNGFKRALDILLVVIAVPLTLPLVAMLAAIIALRGGRPFYSQLRIGAGGGYYRMWKLRTMIHDADRALETYLRRNPDARIEWEKLQKLKNDPRITNFGRKLRKTSLDELPQLWNVLNGTMSLVGPRPMMVEQEVDYPGRAYYKFRPGITGLWQISDRNECRFSERAIFDDEYDRVVSLKTDLRILIATVATVLRGTGH